MGSCVCCREMSEQVQLWEGPEGPGAEPTVLLLVLGSSTLTAALRPQGPPPVLAADHWERAQPGGWGQKR